ncbi:MAG: hypothetical protein FD138_3102 [Planctomycetota bacterium]|nr:MAG: hypothetical protein FD138_3102 [Planctomycetota bacterium]
MFLPSVITEIASLRAPNQLLQQTAALYRFPRYSAQQAAAAELCRWAAEHDLIREQ